MNAAAFLIDKVLEIYIYMLVANVILSWLVAFNVINTSNQFVSSIGQFLYRITEPVLKPVRKVIPQMGGLDVSPIIVILLMTTLQILVADIFAQ